MKFRQTAKLLHLCSNTGTMTMTYNKLHRHNTIQGRPITSYYWGNQCSSDLTLRLPKSPGRFGKLQAWRPMFQVAWSIY